MSEVQKMSIFGEEKSNTSKQNNFRFSKVNIKNMRDTCFLLFSNNKEHFNLYLDENKYLNCVYLNYNDKKLIRNKHMEFINYDLGEFAHLDNLYEMASYLKDICNGNYELSGFLESLNMMSVIYRFVCKTPLNINDILCYEDYLKEFIELCFCKIKISVLPSGFNFNTFKSYFEFYEIDINKLIFKSDNNNEKIIDFDILKNCGGILGYTNDYKVWYRNNNYNIKIIDFSNHPIAYHWDYLKNKKVSCFFFFSICWMVLAFSNYKGDFSNLKYGDKSHIVYNSLLLEELNSVNFDDIDERFYFIF